MKKHYLLSLVMALCSLLHAQNYTWQKMPSAPFILYNPAVLNLGGNIYIVSGVRDNSTTPLTMGQEVWEFNTTTNQWIQKNNFPGTAVFGATAFVINGFGYISNGWDSSNSATGPSATWQYDPTGDTWTQKAPFPGSQRYTCASFAVGGKGYIAGGFRPYTSEVWQYDPTADAWTQKSDMPGIARQAATTFTIGSVAYVGAGATSGDYIQSDWYKYDYTSDTWTRLGYFPGNPIAGASPFVLDGNAYLVGGADQNQFNQQYGASNKIWEYTPGNDTWTMIGLFPDTAVTGGAGSQSSTAGYIGLGENHADGQFNLSTYENLWWRYGPAIGATSCTIDSTVALRINNATFDFQVVGSFSPTAVITWNFGDGHTGSGTSVIHQFDSAGTYTVIATATDTAGGGCSNAFTSVITVSHLNNCSVTVSNTHLGNYYTLTASSTGGGPYSYLWTKQNDSSWYSTSPDPLVWGYDSVPATYCVTVTDTSGCSASGCTTFTYIPDTVGCHTYLYIYPDPNIPGLYWADVYHTGGTPVSYSWSFGDGGVSIDSFPNYTYTFPGFFYVCLSITDSNNCTSSYCDSFFYIYKAGGGPMSQLNTRRAGPELGIHTISTSAISVYPNPANSTITIDLKGDKAESVEISDVSGRVVSTVSAPANNIINVNDLTDGIYFVQVKTQTSSGWTKFTKTSR